MDIRKRIRDERNKLSRLVDIHTAKISVLDSFNWSDLPPDKRSERNTLYSERAGMNLGLKILDSLLEAIAKDNPPVTTEVDTSLDERAP